MSLVGSGGLPKLRTRRRSYGAPAFSSNLEAMQLAKKVWICTGCDRWYSTGKRQKDKPVCDGIGIELNYGQITAKGRGCGAKVFLYFASEGQARRYMVLRAMERAGKIRDLISRGPSNRFALNVVTPSGEPETVCDYIADFTYYEHDELIVEDYKAAGSDEATTRLFRHKAEHFRIQYGVQIRITSD